MTTHLQATLSLPWEEALERLTSALQAEGFGIVSSLAMHDIFKNKLSVEFPPYLILGACNPAFALRVLQADPRGGLLLPCNVTVEAVDGGVRISLDNPETSFAVGDLIANPAIRAVASEARQRLERVARALEAANRAEGGLA